MLVLRRAVDLRRRDRERLVRALLHERGRHERDVGQAGDRTGRVLAVAHVVDRRQRTPTTCRPWRRRSRRPGSRRWSSRSGSASSRRSRRRPCARRARRRLPCCSGTWRRPCTASGDALNRLGTIGLSTSARTAMWISSAVIPTSVALGFSLLDCAPAVAVDRRDSGHDGDAERHPSHRLHERCSPRKVRTTRQSDGSSGIERQHTRADHL